MTDILKIVSFRKLSKRLSRKGLYSVLETHVGAIPAGSRVGNFGSSGQVPALMRRMASIVGFNLTNLDIDPDRNPDLICDITQPLLEAGCFDVIVMCEILEHVSDPHAAVRGLKHLLRPSGLLILSTPFIFPIHGRPFDYFRFTKYGLALLFKEWGDLKVMERNNWAEAVNVLFARVAFEKSKSARFGGRILLIFAVLMSPVAYLAGRLIKTDFMTTGYIVTCRRPEQD